MNSDLFVVTEPGISAQLEAMCIEHRKISSRPTDKLHIFLLEAVFQVSKSSR